MDDGPAAWRRHRVNPQELLSRRIMPIPNSASIAIGLTCQRDEFFDMSWRSKYMTPEIFNRLTGQAGRELAHFLHRRRNFGDAPLRRQCHGERQIRPAEARQMLDAILRRLLHLLKLVKLRITPGKIKPGSADIRVFRRTPDEKLQLRDALHGSRIEDERRAIGIEGETVIGINSQAAFQITNRLSGLTGSYGGKSTIAQHHRIVRCEDQRLADQRQYIFRVFFQIGAHPPDYPITS